LGKLLPNADPPHKVTILPRGMALGYTLTLPSEDRFLMSKAQMLDEMTVFLGGRVAEQLVFNEVTTGAQNDLERCTEMARRMVCEFGMSPNLGPLTLGRRHGPVFLGRDFHEDRNYSEEVAAKIDVEIRNIVDSCYDNAMRTLTENREVLDRIVNVLLEKETIGAEELDRLVNGEPEPPSLTPSEPPAPTAPSPVANDGGEKEKMRAPGGGLQPGLAGA
jgi:cell division protease FtsH